jgi:hypothetical protein
MTTFKYQIEKSASRAQFEADKLRRINKIRSAVDKVRKGIKGDMNTLSQKALEMAIAGETLAPPLKEITDRIIKMQEEVESRLKEIEGIKAEAWVPPPPPPPPPPPQPKPVAAKPEPKHSVQMPTGSRVSQRLMAYVEVESNRVDCPQCRSLVGAEDTVCANCGYRLDTGSETPKPDSDSNP